MKNRNTNEKKSSKGGSIALYVLAVLLLCYGAYMMYSAYQYAAQYYSYQGSDIGSHLGEVLQYMFTQSYQYICLSVLFYVAGVLLQKVNDLHACLCRETKSEAAVNDRPDKKEDTEANINTVSMEEQEANQAGADPDTALKSDTTDKSMETDEATSKTAADTVAHPLDEKTAETDEAKNAVKEETKRK